LDPSAAASGEFVYCAGRAALCARGVCLHTALRGVVTLSASGVGVIKAMYAIVETGGKQYRVKPGDTVAVEKLAGEPGEILDLDPVLMVAGNGEEERVGYRMGACECMRAVLS